MNRPVLSERRVMERLLQRILRLLSRHPVLMAMVIFASVTLPFLQAWQVMAVKPEPATAAVRPVGDPQEEVHPMEPAQALIHRIVGRKFESRDEVATGRVVSEFEAVALELEKVDPAGMKALHRGKGWAVVEVPFRSSDSGSGSSDSGWEGQGEAGSRGGLRLRFSDREGRLKLDGVKKSVSGERR